MQFIRFFVIIIFTAVAGIATADDPTPIIDLHQNDEYGAPDIGILGETFTVEGVVTVPTGAFNGSYTDIYIQDDTAGLSVFAFDSVDVFSMGAIDQLELGDEIRVTGTIIHFNGLTELEPLDPTITGVPSIEFIGGGRPVPEPLLITCLELRDTYNFDTNTEPNEGRLVRLNNVTWNRNSLALTDDTDSSGLAMMYIDYDTGIDPDQIEGEFNVVGVVKQYDNAGDDGPWYLGYEVVPRFISDITYGSGPQFLEYPKQTDVAMGGATIEWTTDAECETILEYGLTDNFELDPIQLGNSTTEHQAVLTGLDSATVYYVRAVATDGVDPPVTSPAITIISPSEQSSGDIDVYFSQSVDTSYSTGVPAMQTDIAERMIERINAATSSIDFCFFSFTRSDVAAALVDAHNRGVDVRVIYEIEDSVINSLEAAGVEVRTDPDEEHQNTHNKFAVFDTADGSETNDYVWTGSWNASYAATTSNAENVVVVQDAALAKSYTIEFDEMWAGSFSTYKDDNTPHLFLIDGIFVEQYMSPSDGLKEAMQDLIGSAQSDIMFAIYSFTLDEIADALVDAHNGGLAVRAVFDADNATDPEYEDQYESMVDAGIDAVLDDVEHGGSDQLLHHKYLLADPLEGSADPMVVTGSYNWTYTADTYKDENILVFHDATIANIFFQEWMARYKEAGGTWDTGGSATGTPVYFPAGAAAAGAGTSYWSTDAEVNNRGDQTMTYSIRLLKRGQDNTDAQSVGPFTLEPGESARYTNVFGDLFGFEGAGALAFDIDRPDDAVLTSRTFNAFDDGNLAGTFGQAIPAVRGSDLIGPSTTVRLIGLAEDSDFRSNIGFMNATDENIRIYAEFFLADGSSLGESSIDLAPYSNNQWNRAFRRVTSDPVADGYVDVWTDNGSFTVYGSVVGNDDFNDPTTVLPRMTAMDGLWVYFPAGAAADGAGGSYWSTDAEINNLGDDVLNYSIQLLKRGRDNTNPQEVGPFTLDPGMSARYTNVFGDVFGFEGAGAFSFSIDNPADALLTSRTFNAFDDGNLAGTFGQGIPAIGSSDLIGPSTKVRLIGLAEDENFRTNIGFMNATASSIRIYVEFFLADGTSLGQEYQDLAPYSNNQWNRAFTRITGNVVEDGYVDVWTDNGSFTVYGSVVGNDDFNDPTTVVPQ